MNQQASVGRVERAVLAGCLVMAVVGATSGVALAGGSHGGGHHHAPIVNDPLPKPTIETVASGRWSDPAIWSGGRLPAQGDVVWVRAGASVEFDAQARVRGLNLEGTLHFSRTRSATLTLVAVTTPKRANLDGSLVIMKGGVLELGSSEAAYLPADVQATIVFDVRSDEAFKGGKWKTERGKIVTGAEADIDDGFRRTDSGLWVLDGGTLALHGAPIARTWGKLQADAAKGATVLSVAGDLRWPVGGKAVVTTTTRRWQESELVEVKSVRAGSGGTTLVTLAKGLKHSHEGTAPAQGEVGLLSRNVVVTSASKADRGFVVCLPGSEAVVTYAELRTLGPAGKLFRYPLTHMCRDNHGELVKGASIWDSKNRWLGIVMTDNVIVEDCVTFDCVGHGFNLESGFETGTKFRRNLGVLARMPAKKVRLESKEGGYSSVFWIKHPHNTLVGNVAVSAGESNGGRGFGFRFLRTEPNGGRLPSDAPAPAATHLALTRFENNESHGNGKGVGFFGLMLRGKEPSAIKGLKSWRNANSGLVLRASHVTLSNFHMFGNCGEGRLLKTGKSPSNVRILGSNNLIRDGVLEGELPSRFRAAMRDTSPDPRYRPTPTGVLAEEGVNNRVLRVRLSRHQACPWAVAHKVVGADVKFMPTKKGRTTLTLEDSRCLSPLPVSINPKDPRSNLRFLGYRGTFGKQLPKNFRLFPHAPTKPAPKARHEVRFDAWLVPLD